MRVQVNWYLRYNRFDEIAKRIPEVVGAIVTESAGNIEANAQALAPVDTGNLKNSIKAKMTSQTSAEVSVGAEYGVYVEYGHTASNGRHVSAHPFFTPAVEKVRASFKAALAALESQL